MKWSERSIREKVELLYSVLEKLSADFHSHQHGKDNEILCPPDWVSLAYNESAIEKGEE